MIWQIYIHDLRILWRDGYQLLHPTIISLATMLLLPLLLFNEETIQQVGFAHLHALALFFATLLTIPLVYSHDTHDNQQMLYSLLKVPNWKQWLSKTLLFFTIAYLPLIFFAPNILACLACSLILSLLATLVATLTRTLGSTLATILALPLCLPILLWYVGAAS